MAVVRQSVGKLIRGNILVSNFNNKANLQGTGTTIVEISPSGTQTLFAQINAATLPGPCPGGVGLTTALVVLRQGWVIVGSLPTTDGMSATAQAGCLLVLDSQGTVVTTIAGPLINGPWDMTAVSGENLAVLFVTNVLNGTVAANGNVVNRGTVVRILLQVGEERAPRVLLETVIGSGFAERTDPAALVIGPTGVGFAAGGGDDDVALRGDLAFREEGQADTLYVADSLNNRIAAIPHALFRFVSAGTGRDVSVGGALNDPLGLTTAPNGDILTVNGNDGNMVETTPRGAQIAVKTVDSTGSPPGAGTLFGLAIMPGVRGVFFVDDGSNTLNLLH
jgi:hypothetical protein